MKIIGYARTTINDVDLTTQVEQLSDFGCQEIFHETYEVEQNDATAVHLESVIADMQQGDALVVCQLHRLGCTWLALMKESLRAKWGKSISN